jgi:hypothetical protein
MATLSGAAIVLALTAILVGLQMSSRFGSRASRMVTTRPVAALMTVAALLGVALPLWAAAESGRSLRTVAFASFPWTILVLGVAGSRVLAHLNPRWLAVQCVNQLHPFLAPAPRPGLAPFHQTQSVLLEIASGAAEGDDDGHAARRALVYVGLVGYRLTGTRDDLSELTETLGARARSAAHRGESPVSVAQILSLIGLTCGDSDISMSVLQQQADLAQDAIQQRREPVVRALLDEASGFATDRLHSLLDRATIPWLEDQEPIRRAEGLRFFVSQEDDAPPLESSAGAVAATDSGAVLAWVNETLPASRLESAALAALLPPLAAPSITSRAKPQVVAVAPRRVEPDVSAIDLGDDRNALSEEPVEQIVIADLGEFLTDGKQAAAPDDQPEQSESEWQRTLDARHRSSDAYDVLEALVATLAASVAAPSPEDQTWPGGWRGSGAFSTDVQRLSGASRSLYESGRYPPTGKAEQAIEDVVQRLVRQEPGLLGDRRPDPVGWRTGETALQHSATQVAPAAMRELAVEAWQAGFARRSLLSVRRLVAVFTTAVERGDARRLEELEEEVQLSVVRTARATDTTIADRVRSRQFALALAPEFSTLGRAIEPHQDDRLWDAT